MYVLIHVLLRSEPKIVIIFSITIYIDIKSHYYNVLDEAESVISPDEGSDDDESEEEMLIFDMKESNDDKSKNGMYLSIKNFH